MKDFSQQIESSKGDVEELEVHEDCFCWNPPYNRFIALFLILFLLFLLAANFDLPASLEDIIQNIFDIPPYKFEYLYLVFSLPNIVMCFFSGLLMDRVFGLRRGSMVFAIISLFGQIVFTVGGFIRIYWLMLLGRLVYGVGAETVAMILNCFIVIWYREKEVTFVYGLFISISRLSTAFTFYISIPLHNYAEEHFEQWAVFGVSITPFLGMVIAQTIVLGLLGYYSEKNGKLTSNTSVVSEQVVRFRQILEFPIIFWIILLMISICFNAGSSFVSCSEQLLKTKYSLTQNETDYLCSFYNVIGAFISLIFGLIVDKVGLDVYFSMVALILGLISQIIMAFTDWTPYIPLVMFSLFVSVLFTCGMPMVSRVVEPYQMATAYGTLTCFVNLIRSVSNVLAGYILGNYGPTATSLLFSAYIILSIVCCLIIWFLDRRGKGILNMTYSQRRGRIN